MAEPTIDAILQAAERLYEQGDAGFSIMDGVAVGSILKAKQKQARQIFSLWTILRPYQEKLSAMGVEYQGLVPPEPFVTGTIVTQVTMGSTVSLKKVETKNGPRVAISAPYDEHLVKVIKTLKSREFDKEGKTGGIPLAWLIPNTPVDVEMAIAALKTENCILEVDPELRVLMEKGKASYQESRAHTAELVIPTKIELYPFQKAGVKWIDDHDGRAFVADDMGVGKSAQSLGYLVLRPEKTLPALILCPSLVRVNWYREVSKFTELRPLLIVGKTAAPGFKKAGLEVSNSPLAGYDVTITNYDLLSVETPDIWLRQLLKKDKELEKYAEKHLAWAGLQAQELLNNAMMKYKDIDSLNRINRVLELIAKQGSRARKIRDPEYKIVYVNGIPFEEFVKAGYKTLICDESHFLKTIEAQRTVAAIEISGTVKNAICLSGTPIDNRPRELWSQIQVVNKTVAPKFFDYGLRYCLPKEAPILMADFTEKEIQHIKVGDKIIGWEEGNGHGKQRKLCEASVKRILKRKACVQRVCFEDGSSLICTSDHKWLNGFPYPSIEERYYKARVGRGGGQGRGSATPIVKIYSPPKPTKPSSGYKHGYLHGAIRGDGYCSRLIHEKYSPFQGTLTRGIKKHSVGYASQDLECIRRVSDYLNMFNLRHSISPICSDGVYRISMSDKKAYDFFRKQPYKSREWCRGFLAGIYDSEGSGAGIHQYRKVNPITWKMIGFALRMFNFKYLSREKYYIIRGGRKELLRLWSLAAPCLTRKIKSYIFSQGAKFLGHKVYVKSIVPLKGIHDVYTLTTETGNYVAYGYGSKNCGAFQKPAAQGRMVWDFSGVSNIAELDKLLRSTIMIRRTKDQVLKELPPKTRTMIPFVVDDAEDKIYRKEEAGAMDRLRELRKERQDWKASIDALPESDRKAYIAKHAEKASRQAGLKDLAIAEIEKLKEAAVNAKYSESVEFILGLKETQGKILIFAVHHAIIDRLVASFREKGLKTDFIDGRVKTNRQAVVDSFQMGDLEILVCGIRAASIGITLTASHTVAFVELDWTPGIHAQAEDRVARIGQLKPVTIYYLLLLGSIEEKIAKMIDAKRAVVNSIMGEGDRTAHEAGILDAVLDELLDGKNTGQYP